MSHYRLEVIMPPAPAEKIGELLDQIMAPYCENNDLPEDRDDNSALYEWAAQESQAFWDFFVVGGRFAGSKLEASLDPEKFDQFQNELQERGITVSGITFGKPTLSPASQEKDVDQLWRDYFPGTTEHCPLFSHSNNQYDSDDTLPSDICTLAEVPANYRCAHLMIATPQFNYRKKDSESSTWDGPIACEWQIQKSIWNGSNFIDSAWDGSVAGAVDMFRNLIEHRNEDYKAVIEPKPDWLCITVDYHS